MAKKKEQTALIYKGKPLVKRGNTVIYGDINDKYYLHISILDTDMEKDLELATEVLLKKLKERAYTELLILELSGLKMGCQIKDC